MVSRGIKYVDLQNILGLIRWRRLNARYLLRTLLLLLLLYMSIIMVALSHYCCMTTLQCQCHVSQATRHVRESIHRETLPKQHHYYIRYRGLRASRACGIPECCFH